MIFFYYKEKKKNGCKFLRENRLRKYVENAKERGSIEYGLNTLTTVRFIFLRNVYNGIELFVSLAPYIFLSFSSYSFLSSI